MKKLVCAVALTTLPAVAMAEFPVGKVGLRLSPVVDMEFSGPGGSVDGDGNAFGFHGELGSDTLFGYADHQTSDLDFDGADVELDETRFGVGIRAGNNTGTIEARVERYDSELDDGEDDGMAMHVGGELPLSGSAAVYGSFGFLSLDDSDGNEFRLGISGNVAPTTEIFAEYRYLGLELDDPADVDVDLDDFRVGVNLLF